MMTAYVRVAALLLMLFAASPFCWAATQPKDIMLVFDNSGSMRHSDPHHLAKGVITRFVDGLPADTHFGVLIFDKVINLALPLTALDQAGKKAVAESLKAINYRGQLTNSPSAMERAIYELRVNGRSDAQKIVVFMTDGIVDVGNPSESQDKATWLRTELADEAAKNKIRIYAIAFTADADYQLIQSLATKTNGEYYRALKAEDLHGAFEHIAQAIASLQAPAPAAQAQPAKPAETAPEAATPAPAPAATPAEAPKPAAESEAAAPAAAPESQAAPAAPTTAPESQAAPAAPATMPESQTAPATAPESQATQPAPAPTPESQAAPATPPASQAAPSAAQPSAAEKASAEKAAEEFEKETGISKEELEKLPEGQAIIVRPGHENKGMGLVILAVGGVLIVLVIVGLFIFLKKRGGKKKAAAPARSVAIPEEEEYVPRAFLRDLQGNTDLSEHELGTKPVMMGRVPGGDAEHVHYIVVNQPTIGRRHALIEYKDFSYWIVDQASVNGTFVNGQRVTGEQRLKHGDKIRLHKYEFEFVMPEVADAGKTVFAGGSDKTVIADATLMQAEPVQPAAPEPPPAPLMEEAEEEGEEAFDVTGGFDAASLPPASAGLEAMAEPEGEEAEEIAPASSGGDDMAFLESAGMDLGGLESEEQEQQAEQVEQAEEQRPDLFEPAAEAPAESPEPATGEEGVGEEQAGGEELHDRETVVLGPDSVPAAAPAPAESAPQEPVSAESGEAEDVSLDSFISTTVLEASQLDQVSQPKQEKPGGDMKIGSEDPTIMPGSGESIEQAPAPQEAAPPSAPAEEEASLDDFLDSAAMMASGIRQAQTSDKTVVLSEDEESDDKTLMPSQVEEPGKSGQKKDEEETHMGDTTVFNADDVTLPPKKDR